MGQSKVSWSIFSNSPLKKGMINNNFIFSKACIVLSLQTQEKMCVEHVVSNYNLIVYWTKRLIELCFNFNNFALSITSLRTCCFYWQEPHGRLERVQINNNTYVVPRIPPAAI